MRISFRPDRDLAESQVGEDGISITPRYYTVRSKYTSVGTIEVETSGGISLGQSQLQIDVESGDLRVVALVEADEMPVDKETPDLAVEALEEE